MHAHVVIARHIGRSPYVAQYLAMRDDPLGIGDHRREQAIFDRGEVHVRAALADDPSREIAFHVAESKHRLLFARRGGLRAGPRERARQQLADTEGGTAR